MVKITMKRSGQQDQKLLNFKQPKIKQQPDYSKVPLYMKLGIKSGQKYIIINPPANYLAITGLKNFGSSKLTGKFDFIHFFTMDVKELLKKFPSLKSHLSSNGMLWVSWPKKASNIKTELDDNVVRDMGLENGLVDVKVVAVDPVWSAIKFVYRLRDR